MGVCEEAPPANTMHWQHERYTIGPAYDPSRDLSPNLPVHSDSSSGGEGEGCSSTTSTTDNNNSGLLSASSCCRFSDFGPSKGPSSSPPAPPSSAAPLAQCKMEEESSAAVSCAGCGSRICDRYYLLAVDRKWHVTCLQCSQCRQALDGEVTCFARDGNIYCKKDYYRLFGMRRCARCQAAILSSELVMRARDLVFHVHCFTCSACQTPLTKGDQFGMHGPNVFCQHHFEVATAGPPPSLSPPLGPLGPHGPHGPIPCPQLTANPFPYHQPPFPSPAGDYSPNMPPSLPQQPPPPNPSPCALEPKPFFNGGPAPTAPSTPRQKGRPRKRKPKDLEGLTANLDLNSDSYLDVATPFGRSGSSPGGLSSSQSRTKRMRTSFKHHQLRTMKSYFAINHNPDAKDLKQLSQKTGLPKRVLQVWFQNARAKWRRMMIKQEGKIPSDKQGLDSPCGGDLQQSHLGHPHSDYLHMQGDPSCSPQYMMGSPSSLDCV
ncbi:protein apterous-like isoform X2 [Neocloeon triangulifer]|uniref:protein apterous-like isoform X2 n=1 Tax=Neocloeon triangulifer TaxID=2078957 RepID=UPI00286F251C|nr:protein apterous-like isoform X2 [Neocloeon triangulifer]